MYEHSSAMTTV